MYMRCKIFIFLVLFLAMGAVLVLVSQAGAEEGKFHSRYDKSDSACNIGAWMASIFRDHISRIDGDRCPSLPTCSSYSVLAFRKHGFFMGWLMTVDRLIHEGSEEMAVSPLVYYRGRMKIFDPVENNDFWWYKQRADHNDHNE